MVIHKPRREASEETSLANTLISDFQPQELWWNTGVPFVAQWVKNPTSIHKDAGLIPSLAQWVKDPVLPWAVVKVTDMAQIWHCCGCGVGWHHSSDWTPSPRTSVCHRCGPKKKRKQNKTKKNGDQIKFCCLSKNKQKNQPNKNSGKTRIKGLN